MKSRKTKTQGRNRKGETVCEMKHRHKDQEKISQKLWNFNNIRSGKSTFN